MSFQVLHKIERRTPMSEELKEQVKAELLKLGENVSAEAVKSVFKIAELAIKDSENLFDDMLLPALPKLQEVVLGFVDKISPEVEQ
jgi:hypothetical protein